MPRRDEDCIRFPGDHVLRRTDRLRESEPPADIGGTDSGARADGAQRHVLRAAQRRQQKGLGEGTGAALGMFLIEAAMRTYLEMATFDTAGIARGNAPV